MTITVKHTKVSVIPDGDDTSVVRPSDWNDDHQLSGLGTMAEQNANNVAITGGSVSGVTVAGYIPTTEKAQPLGVATLDAGGKVPTSQIPMQGDLNYQGTWNASTNTPTLTSSTGTKGYYYVVDVAGTTNLNGITDWQIGDWAIYNGTIWQKVDNTDAVSSVNGQTGTVVLTTTDIAEGTNEYFTTAKARNSVSAGTGISYVSSTGVITNSAPDQTVAITGAGTSVVTGTYPNFTVTSDDQFDGTVTSVGISSSATSLAITNSPITSNGSIGVNFAGSSGQYVRGDGALANFPASTGGGSSFAYYLNGGTNQGTFVGNTYYEMSRIPVIGTNADFNISTDGYIAQFITDAGDPALLAIPAGNWNFGLFFSVSNHTGNPSFYVELSKYNGTTFTAIASSVGTPEPITNGTTIDIYNTSLAVPTTTLTLTDRLAVRVYVIYGGGTRTVTLHTQDSHLCEIITTFSTGLTALNGLTAQVQYLGVGTTGSDFNIASATDTHTFNIPTASATNRGALSSTDWTTFNNKQPAGTYVNSVSGTAGRVTSTGGVTPVIDLASSIATAGTTGSSTLIPVVTVDTYGRVTSVTTAANPQGTVTSVTATSPVTSTGGATPVIAMPAATTSVSGYLTSTDWNTFNSKGVAVTYTTNYVPYGQGTTTPALSIDFQYNPTLKNLIAPQVRASNGIVVNSKTVSASYIIASGDSAMSAGPMTIASGVTVTVSSGSRWVVL
jgi:hypothetical protein